MAQESFYGITLKGKNANVEWDPAQEDNEFDLDNGQKLIIKQAVLGTDAVEGETNVIVVETTTMTHSIKIPVAILKYGSVNQVGLDLTFPDPPVTFSLAEGSGPVHIAGLQLIGSENLDNSDYLEESALMSDEETDSDNNKHVITNGKGK